MRLSLAGEANCNGDEGIEARKLFAYSKFKV